MTDFVILPRNGGKTTALVGWLLTGPWTTPPSRVALVANEAVRSAVIDRLLRYGVDPRVANEMVIIASRANLRALHGRQATFGVDDVEHVLGQLLGAPVAFVTGTQEELNGGS